MWQKMRAGAAKDLGKLGKQAVLLVRDQKLNYLQLSRSFKISGMLERHDYILEFLCMMHEAVDMRLTAVHVQMVHPPTQPECAASSYTRAILHQPTTPSV